ncbi:MAG: pyridoxal phosphate-dependent aminotransferase [Alphaproteobacteria bacterium]|nr:pyridoxal phosphate-dependent aminotransferase [Alphaproteobacteria bacterium]
MKWAVPEKLLEPDEAAADPLPMWVADMDFRAPQPVLDALAEAVRHGVFGYPGGATTSYLKAITDWQGKRFGWEVAPGWIVQTAGIVATLKTIIQAFSQPGDSVLVQPPVYAHFHQDAVINGRHPAMAPLVLDSGRYRFDAKIFEAAIRPDTRIFILCNPHNPTGNVWSEADLRTMGEICNRHGILVVADEIHQDFVLNRDLRHIPYASLGEAFAQNSISCTAPSKTFNLAGLQSANVFIPNPRIRDQFKRILDRNSGLLVNTLGMVAAEAAYRHGEPWLEALLAYIRANQAHFAAEIHKATQRLSVLPADSLYLAWMDCRALEMPAPELNKFMLTKARVWLDKGQKFGPEGHGFMRVNLGCPRATVDEGIRRIVAAV